MPADGFMKYAKTKVKKVIGQNRVTGMKNRANDFSLALKNRFVDMDLAAIGRHLQTDKVDRFHRFNGLSYLDIYEQYLRKRKNDYLNILEIGVKDGASLKTWKAYFPNANIFGVDIDPACKALENSRIHIETGSQDDESFLLNMFTPGIGFDIIIDDGSHINRHIIRSFECLFYHRMNPGGIYIIEDLGCSYEPLQTKYDIINTWPGMKYNDMTQDLDNRRQDMERFFLEKIQTLDQQKGEIVSVQFWSGLCIILKKVLEEDLCIDENKERFG